MLDFLHHKLKNLFLLSLSLILLPIDTALILGVDLWSRYHGFNTARKQQPVPAALRKTILVTGVGMSKGLALARQFHSAGHRVVGADFHRLSPGRVSAAIDVFHRLPWPRKTPLAEDEDIEDDPYALALLEIVKEEGVDLWVSVSDVNTAIQDALAAGMVESQTSAKACQLNAKYVRILHEKDLFMQYTKNLGLPVPDTQVVSTRPAVVDFLVKRGGLKMTPGAKRYLLKPVGVNDIARYDMPLLPLASEQETLRRIDSVPMEGADAFIMQEFIPGPEFCTHALVVRGQVRSFVACPSSELLMHYKALPSDTLLSKSMLAFTEKVASTCGEDFTGHVSFDFLVPLAQQGDGPKDGDNLQIYPIECNPRVHTAVVLFNKTPEVVGEYLSILEPGESSATGGSKTNGTEPIIPKDPDNYYWIGQDFVERLLYPAFEQALRRALPKQSGDVRSFVEHVQYWKDGTFEVWDPWPWWWLYHIYWPVQFLGYLAWGRWHKINVSTGKAFQAE